MLFHSINFAFLLAVTVFLYWISPIQKIRKIFMLIGSIIFYASWSVPFTVVIVSLATAHWLFSRYRISALVMAISISLLAYFKYHDFCIGIFNELAKTYPIGAVRPMLGYELPLGISFYIFQLVAYTVDVRRGHLKEEEDYLTFLLFIMFFPQLIAGPICRGKELLPQLNTKPIFRLQNFYDGLFFLLSGFVLKTCFADGWAGFVDKVFAAPAEFTFIDNWLATFGFGLQIFCDFWGYSTMALGAALLMGISLPYNFNLPYRSQSIREFWKRWHITLSLWLRDYVYIPLGGDQRSKKWILYRNIMITFLLGGMWHGANWTFMIWGLIHGLFLSIERFFGIGKKEAEYTLIKNIISWCYMMSVVFAAWVFFRAESLPMAVQQIKQMFSVPQGLETIADGRYFLLLAAFIPIHIVIHKLTFERLPSKWQWWVSAPVALGLLAFAWKFHVSTSKFIYFQF